MKVSLSSSMAAFWRGLCSLFYLWSWSRFQSMHPWVQVLPTAESNPGLLGAAWQLLVGRQRPSTQLQETHWQFCTFYIISLNIVSIISVISKTSCIHFVSLSPFSSFSLPLVGGWGLIQSICHSVYWRAALNFDRKTSYRKTWTSWKSGQARTA